MRRIKGLAPSLFPNPHKSKKEKKKTKTCKLKNSESTTGNGEKLEKQTEHTLERGGKKVSNLPARAEIILSTLFFRNFRSKTYSEYFSGGAALRQEAALDSGYKSVSRRRAKETSLECGLLRARATVTTMVADPGHAPTYPADRHPGRPEPFIFLQQQAQPCIP